MRTFLAGSAMVLLLSGCVPKAEGPSFTNIEQASLTQSLIYFYRPCDDSSKPFDIYIDDKKASTLLKCGYFKRTVAPGNHKITSNYSVSYMPGLILGQAVEDITKTPTTIAAITKSGTVMYVRLTQKNKFFYQEGSLEIVPEMTARSEISSTKMAE